MGSTHQTDESAGRCHGDDVLAALIEGQLDDSGLAALYAHADRCARCRELLVELARVQRVALEVEAPTEVPARTGAGRSVTDIESGTKLDQYRVVRKIGEGGMGRVFEAEDEALGRSVAIKAVRPRHRATDPDWTVRLVREAQAMAKLTHPNVLTVYGVGTHGADVYFAMELVDGVTLGQWCVEQERPWKEVLRSYIAAGRGLAAAHAAGLVHRDFKPANVLVSKDERVLVTDFGLVAQAGEEAALGTNPPEHRWDDELTNTGMVMGTPAYMAPEQVRSEKADARADQFAFSVALTEALYRYHPFERNVALALGRETWAPRFGDRRGIPTTLERVLTRGMALDPNQRYPTMDALLERLAAVADERRRTLWGGLAAFAVAAAAWLGATVGADATAPTPCPRGEPGDVPDAWGAEQRGAIEARFANETLLAAIDRYAIAWTEMAHEACVATRVRGEVSVEVLDARTTCLDGRRRSLRAATSLLGSGEELSQGSAIDLVHSLPELQPCANLKLLRYLDSPDPDPELRARLDAATDSLWRAHALAMVGSYSEATELLAEVATQADALGHKPLQAEVRQARAAVVADNDAERADALRREGYRLAMVSHADHTAAALALSLAQAAAFGERNWTASRLWLELAESHAERSGLSIELPLEFTRGAVEMARGDYESAGRAFAAAAAAGERSGGRSSDIAAAYANVAACYLELGRPADADAPLRRAIAMMTEAFGPNDARTLDNEANAAAAHRLRGDLDAAHRELSDVLGRQRTALGDAHPSVASTLMALATVERELGNPEAANGLDGEALELRIDVFGMDSAMVASTRRALAEDALALGRLDDARMQLERAVELLEAQLGPQHATTIAAREELMAIPE